MRPLDSDEPDERGRINMLEAASYTSIILLIALVALGLFDVMLPWQ